MHKMWSCKTCNKFPNFAILIYRLPQKPSAWESNQNSSLHLILLLCHNKKLSSSTINLMKIPFLTLLSIYLSAQQDNKQHFVIQRWTLS